LPFAEPSPLPLLCMYPLPSRSRLPLNQANSSPAAESSQFSEKYTALERPSALRASHPFAC
jgi:hypothetical protein